MYRTSQAQCCMSSMQPTIFTSIAGLASKRGIASTLSIALRTTLLRNAHTPRDERACETSLGGDGSSRLGGGWRHASASRRWALAPGSCRRVPAPRVASGRGRLPSHGARSSVVVFRVHVALLYRVAKLRRLLHNEFFLLLFTAQVPRFFWTC